MTAPHYKRGDVVQVRSRIGIVLAHRRDRYDLQHPEDRINLGKMFEMDWYQVLVGTEKMWLTFDAIGGVRLMRMS